MKYRDLHIQTLRAAPNNARTEGFALLVRAGYMNREGDLLGLGEQALRRLKHLHAHSSDSIFASLDLPTLRSGHEVFFPIAGGSAEVIHCSVCRYTERKGLARFRKPEPAAEEARPLEKLATPGTNTIESLANFLGVGSDRTAKALMFTRMSDGKFVFAVMRGDMTLSEAKLRAAVGDVCLAAPEEIARAGAAAGYASPIGLENALIVADDLIPRSPNLAAGANESGFHLLNTNYGRDYQAEIVTDLASAIPGAACPVCGEPLSLIDAEVLMAQDEIHFFNVLRALAEVHHDEKGLRLPAPAAPFDVYLMHLAGKEVDTRGRAKELYESLQNAGMEVLFDDRDERAGVKFNDADLIGLPLRITLGEKHLQNGMIELKSRRADEVQLVSIEDLVGSARMALSSTL